MGEERNRCRVFGGKDRRKEEDPDIGGRMAAP
jgi:hypothetical protein